MVTKKKYRALVGLNFPATPAALKKHKAGEELEPEEITRVEPGEETATIPSESIPWLLADGLIEEVTE